MRKPTLSPGVFQRCRKNSRVPSVLQSRWLNQWTESGRKAAAAGPVKGSFAAAAREKSRRWRPVAKSIRQMPVSSGALTSLDRSRGAPVA